MKLFRTENGIWAQHGEGAFEIKGESWDALVTRDDILTFLNSRADENTRKSGTLPDGIAAPIGTQEVWAAGVTYYRSRNARMEESKSAGGGDFYDRVYDADRPELFFKATPNRVVGPGGNVAIRDDAKWSVPEPELTLLLTPSGHITGYTVGNDMSSRDIEGENPLYLPQAKVYDRSCALGPGILIADGPLDPGIQIKLEILRGGRDAFTESTQLRAMKRDPATLAHYLYRNNRFPNGCFLLTGTGIVPPDAFTLQHGDEIRITIEGIGTLINHVG